MKTAKEITVIGLFVALLIGGQFVLSGISGIEIVTVLIVSFCFYFGVFRGVIVATAFSLLRCFIFGFFPNVIVLYLIFYNLVAIIFGLLGKAFNKSVNLKKLIIIVLLAICLTVFFTALDLLLMMLFYSFTLKATLAYFIAGLPTLITQVICVIVSVSCLTIPLLKVYKNIKIN